MNLLQKGAETCQHNFTKVAKNMIFFYLFFDAMRPLLLLYLSVRNNGYLAGRLTVLGVFK